MVKKMPDNYAGSKTKLVICSCCYRTIMTAVIIFSFFLGSCMAGEINFASASISTTPPIGGQELEEEQDGQLTPESCSGTTSLTSLTDGTNDSTTLGIA